jgi:hypothetical protein
LISPTRNARIASFAAFAATLGDFMMLHAANALGGDPGSSLPGPGLLWAGGVLGVVAIPAYAFGYRAAAGLIHAASLRAARAVDISGLFVAVIGAAIHGLTAVHIARQLASGAVALDPIASVAESGPLLPTLWMVAAAAVLVASLAFSYRVVRGVGSMPRALALASPALLTIAFASIGMLSGPLAAFVTPAAPNLAHIVFFTALAWTSAEPAAARYDSTKSSNDSSM